MTAQCVVAGLFPPNEDEIWNKKLDLWQPIPIHTVPVEHDRFFIPLEKCPRLLNVIFGYLYSPEMAAKMAKHKELLDFLGKNSGQPIKITNLYRLFDTICIEKSRGFP